jgi:Spy/CpxP family protein refolding chaperone
MKIVIVLFFNLVLISNAERVIDLNTKDIYGNAFAKATNDQLQKAFKPVQPPQLINLIAIEAPKDGQGPYTYEQIKYILTSCYTGFKAAQVLANKTQAMNTAVSNTNQRRPSRSGTNTFRTIIHTGWWGCGAYGNNRQMMLITQILAAHWAQIDKIIFHTQNNEHQNDIDKAQKVVQNLVHRKHVEEVIEEIVKLNLEWEKSNNT